MASTASARLEKFQIGRVFNNTFAVIDRNPGLMIALAALFLVLPAVALNLSNHWNGGPNGYIATPPLGAKWVIMSSSFLSLVLSLIYFVCALLFQSSLVQATIEDLNGKRPAIGDCIQIALRSIFPTLGVGLIVFLAMILGLIVMGIAGMLVPIFGAIIAFVVLLVAGIRWLLGISVSVPVLKQERLGMFGAMSRSRALTKGSRWPMFGVFLILFLAALAFQMMFALLIGLIFAFFSGLSTVALIFGAIGSVLIATVVSTVASVAIAVAYVELRQVREGTSVDELAEIFS